MCPVDFGETNLRPQGRVADLHVHRLAIRVDQGERRFYLPQDVFLDLVGPAAEGVGRRP
jgi:hypothetical protein